LAQERHPIPAWVVMGAGTGGTIATVGRFIRYSQHATRVLLADPEGSAFSAYVASGDAAGTAAGSRIEGIGRPRVEPSFIRTLVDAVQVVPNVESVAAMRVLSGLLGFPVGPSTGTHFAAMLALAATMRARGEQGALLSLVCDSGLRYGNTYHDRAWVAAQFGDTAAATAKIEALAVGAH
jgi:cysteine synthase